MYAIAYGIIALGLFGVILAIRGMIFFYKNDEKQIVFISGFALLVLPIIITVLTYIPMQKLNLWIVIPALILSIFWLSIGYFIEVYRKKEIKRLEDGLAKPDYPKIAKKEVIKNIILLIIGIIIWFYGIMIGFTNSTVETCLLSICMFLLAVSLSSLWRCRYYFFKGWKNGK